MTKRWNNVKPWIPIAAPVVAVIALGIYFPWFGKAMLAVLAVGFALVVGLPYCTKIIRKQLPKTFAALTIACGIALILGFLGLTVAGFIEMFRGEDNCDSTGVHFGYCN